MSLSMGFICRSICFQLFCRLFYNSSFVTAPSFGIGHSPNGFSVIESLCVVVDFGSLSSYIGTLIASVFSFDNECFLFNFTASDDSFLLYNNLQHFHILCLFCVAVLFHVEINILLIV